MKRTTREPKSAEPKGSRLVSDPIEIRKLLERSAGTVSDVTIQVRNGGQKLSTRVLDWSPRTKTLTLEPLSEGEEAVLRADLQESPDCLLLIYLRGHHIIGISGKVVELSQKKWDIKVADTLFKIQRRKDVRYVIPTAYEIFIQVPGEGGKRKMKKRVLDLGESGLSFQVISPREAPWYKDGRILMDAVLKLQERRMVVDLEVRNSQARKGMRGDPYFKIGTKFVRIAKDDLEFLSQYVLFHVLQLAG